MFQYQLLAEQLIQKIFSGELIAGQKLNSLRVYAQQQNISLNTAKSCYELLEAKGYVYSKEKSGYFVKSIPVENLEPIYDDFSTQARSISNFELQQEIQNAEINHHLVHLGSIQLSPDLIPTVELRRSIQRALKMCKPEDFLYSERQGNTQLRHAISQHWAEDGVFISQDEIFITNGCMAALSVVIQTITKQGDSIIIPTPTFNGQLQLLASLNRKIVEIPAHQNGFDLERLEHAIKYSGAKACLLTANYQNPIGFCLSNEDKQKIAELAEQYQCYIIEDDIYAECGFSSHRPLPIQYWDQAGYVIYCGSISKSLSSAYRVGWFCVPNQLMHLKSDFLNKNIVVNTPLQLGLADLIYSRAYRNHLNKLRPQLMYQVEKFRQHILKEFDGVNIRINQPQGGYCIWIQFPENIQSLELYRFAQAHRINIVPGIVFGEDERYANFIRLNAGYGLSNQVKEAISLLADWVRKQL